jgi:Tfp pilus assembly protein FimT
MPVRRAGARAFTLIELILVMALMVTVLGLLAPSLSRFFRGRTLDSEARRMVSLTRYGQARAVSEGIPMLMWIDTVRQAYGLEAEYSYTANDDKAVDYALDRDLGVEAQFVRRRTAESGMVRQDRRFGASVVQIRFQPDGFIGEQSPDLLRYGLREAATV